MRVLACDVGTSALKLSVLDFAEAGGALLVGSVRRGYPTRCAQPGWAEQDPADWLEALEACVASLDGAGKLDRLDGLVLTGQMSAGLLVAGDGTPSSPCLIWSDTRASAEAEVAATRIVPADFYRVTGNPLDATYPAAKIAWLLGRNGPPPPGSRFVQPKDWLTMQLCGRAVMDASDASCTGLLDIRERRWDSSLFAAFDLPEALAPDLVDATDTVGTVRADAPGALARLAGLPIIAGGGDGPTSAVGAGTSLPGEAYVSLGTSAWLSFLSSVPVDDPGRRLFSYRHVIPGLFTITGSTQNGGSLLDWLLRDVFQHEEDAGRVFGSALGHVPAGCEGLVMLPYLQGERTPYWSSQASGVFFGLRPRHGREHMVRAAVEALCFQMRLILETFAELGFRADEAGLIGGLGETEGIVDLLSNVMRTRFAKVSRHGEATSIGAGLVAALGLGLVTDPADLSTFVQREAARQPGPPDAAIESNYALFKALYARLEPLFGVGWQTGDQA